MVNHKLEINSSSVSADDVFQQENHRSVDPSLVGFLPPQNKRLFYATIDAVTSGQLTPLVKEELRCSIQARRLALGKDELQIVFDDPQTTQLSEVEEQLRRDRRKKNKLAAQKSRNKKKEKLDVLTEHVSVLEKKNFDLEEEIGKLSEEQRRLEDIFEAHSPFCRLKQQL